MNSRLEKEKELVLKPIRMRVAKQAIQKLNLPITFEDEDKIIFTYGGNPITLYPYSGFHTGKGIRDGRGLMDLLSKLK